MYEIHFLKALTYSLGIEIAVLFFIIRNFYRVNKDEIPDRNLFFSGIIATTLTLPYAWFIFPAFIHDRGIYVITSELSVFLVEAIIYFFLLKIELKKSLIISFLANLCSWLSGYLLFR